MKLYFIITLRIILFLMLLLNKVSHMRRATLLERVPGLSERTLQYLGDKGYIKYEPIQEGDVARRDYPESELPYISCLVSLIQQGLAPRKAFRNAREQFPNH